MNISLGTPTACLPYACRGLERFARFNSWNPHKNYEVDTLATHFTDEVTGAKELSGLPKGTQLLTALPGLVQLMGSRAICVSATRVQTMETALAAQCTEFPINANWLVPVVGYSGHDLCQFSYKKEKSSCSKA